MTKFKPITVFQCPSCDDDSACGFGKQSLDMSYDECHHPMSLEFATALAECFNALEGGRILAARIAAENGTERCKCGMRMILVDNGTQPLVEGIVWRHWWCGCGNTEAAEPLRLPTREERLRADWEEVNKEKP